VAHNRRGSRRERLPSISASGASILEKARSLRVRQTNCELLLWRKLRDRRLAGIKFRRQYAVGGYIVDFFCPDARLAIELDGGEHATRRDYDLRRERDLTARGIRTVRFWNSDVLQNLDGVLQTILAAVCEGPPSP